MFHLLFLMSIYRWDSFCSLYVNGKYIQKSICDKNKTFIHNVRNKLLTEKIKFLFEKCNFREMKCYYINLMIFNFFIFTEIIAKTEN